MKRTARLVISTAAACGVALAVSAVPAPAVIHEQVAAYCSGGGVGTITVGGELEPSGISDPTKSNFARPVVANGVVDVDTLAITDHPAAKFPAGTSVFDANVEATAPDHPSSHCNGLQQP